MSELSTMLTTHGEEIALVDDTTYLVLRAVYACQAGLAPALYCAESDWPHTHAARLDAKERQIAELTALAEKRAAEIAQLSQRLAALESHLAANESDPGPCPECGKTEWRSVRALQMHRQRVHQGMQATRPKIALLDDQGWRCATKGCSGAFARSLTDPDFCTQHARVEHTNGVEIAA